MPRETPNELNPNHFLDADGKFTKTEAFLLFFTGDSFEWVTRQCHPEGDNVDSITERCINEACDNCNSLLRKFTFQPLPEVTESGLDFAAEVGFTVRPRPQSACASLNDEADLYCQRQNYLCRFPVFAHSL
ncbi:Cytochrome P450 2K4 [Chelonia mydas]|uniref:Cytochrome P450 2K4 n=1 Tax=Chelonia mydas TaxID=8469 RepID=M7BR73_CHEMY|nr:Cytochrome P450 2K4 [Chelonia mydas]